MSAVKQDKLKLLIANLTLLNYYKKYVNVFLKDLVNQLLENKSHDHAIDLESDKTTSYESLYNLSMIKLTML